MRHERPHQNIGDPPLVRMLGFVSAEHLRFRGERGPVQTAAMKLSANGALRDPDAVAVPDDVRDLGCRTGRDLDPQRGDTSASSGMSTHTPNVCPAGLGRNPSSPPARHARTHLSIVARE